MHAQRWMFHWYEMHAPVMTISWAWGCVGLMLTNRATVCVSYYSGGRDCKVFDLLTVLQAALLHVPCLMSGH